MAASSGKPPRSVPRKVVRDVRPRYRHVISLGFFCSTALELQRYGLRDGSYPLDWNISPLGPTLAMVESGFDGFLKLDCLERDADNPGIVHDSGSGIAVYNSFDPAVSIAEQYEVVRQMYARRIKRYRQAVARRTLFVRYILDREEFAYLDENMAAVLASMRHTHPQNDLLLVGNAGLPATCGGLEVYTVAVDDGDTVARKFVSKNPQLRSRLLTLDYPLTLRLWNLARYWGRRLRGWLRPRARLRGARSSLFPRNTGRDAEPAERA